MVITFPSIAAITAARCVVSSRWPGSWHGRILAAWVVPFLLLYVPVAHGAENAIYEENQVKGVFLAKFAMFVDWPDQVFPDSNEAIVIGLMGDDPFGPRYEAALVREVVRGRRFKVKRFKELSGIKGCQILFVSRSESQRLPEILATVGKQPILVVGDQERFGHQGGMMNFVKEGGKLRFEVNMAAVGNSGLRMSAKLLDVAKLVKTDSSNRARE